MKKVPLHPARGLVCDFAKIQNDAAVAAAIFLASSLATPRTSHAASYRQQTKKQLLLRSKILNTVVALLYCP